jgi:hypothetical protein
MNVRRFSTLLVLGSALGLGLSGCGGDGPIKPAPLTLTPSPSSPTTSPSTTGDSQTPSPLPTAAKKKTVAGAEAFAEYYWQMVNYAQSSQDVAPLRKLASETCKACSGGADGLQETFDSGGKITGGVNSTSVLSGKVLYAGTHRFWEVVVRTHTTAEKIDFPAGKADSSIPAATYKTRMNLSWLDGSWQIESWEDA